MTLFSGTCVSSWRKQMRASKISTGWPMVHAMHRAYTNN